MTSMTSEVTGSIHTQCVERSTVPIKLIKKGTCLVELDLSPQRLFVATPQLKLNVEQPFLK